MSAPLVSVVIATWNGGRYLPATLESVLAQTWQRLEVIVVDDGSTDDTLQVIAPYLPRIRYERRRHLGLAVARNEGVRLSQGDYVALLDADDLWHPEKLATQVAIAERHPESGLIVSDGEEFSDADVLRGSLFPAGWSEEIQAAPEGEVTRDCQRAFIERNLISCPAQVLIPRHVLEQVGPFADSGAQDYDYYLRVSRDYPVTFHRHALVRWRYRPESMSGPRETRWLRWSLFTLPVLLAHRARCRAGDRALLSARIQWLTRSLCHDLMTRGRHTGRLAASSTLLEVLRVKPWPPTPLVYLAGLWAPGPVYQLGVRVSRPLRSAG